MKYLLLSNLGLFLFSTCIFCCSLNFLPPKSSEIISIVIIKYHSPFNVGLELIFIRCSPSHFCSISLSRYPSVLNLFMPFTLARSFNNIIELMLFFNSCYDSLYFNRLLNPIILIYICSYS